MSHYLVWLFKVTVGVTNSVMVMCSVRVVVTVSKLLGPTSGQGNYRVWVRVTLGLGLGLGLKFDHIKLLT